LKHKQENVKNKKLLTKILERWNRAILNRPADFRGLDGEARLGRAMEASSDRTRQRDVKAGEWLATRKHQAKYAPPSPCNLPHALWHLVNSYPQASGCGVMSPAGLHITCRRAACRQLPFSSSSSLPPFRWARTQVAAGRRGLCDACEGPACYLPRLHRAALLHGCPGD